MVLIGKITSSNPEEHLPRSQKDLPGNIDPWVAWVLPWVASRIKVSAAPSIPTKNHNYGDFTPFQAPHHQVP